MRRWFHTALVSICILALFLPPASAQEFKTNNPDRGKYEFAVSYIAALGYFNTIERRWKKSPNRKFPGNDVALMRSYVEYLIKDNADIRIAKNYLIKYLQSPNALIRKTSDMFIAACQRLIAINDKEKEIWDQWYAVKSNNMGNKANERAFIKAQQELSYLRKSANNSIVEASVLLVKVLKSERNKDERGRILALTNKERDKLIKNLDAYAKDMLEWGLKPGQGHVEASVGVLREILEDSIYTTIK